MAAIDRAILRLAIHEMQQAQTPAKVVLNEAVDLAKEILVGRVGGFVNGILDSVVSL